MKKILLMLILSISTLTYAQDDRDRYAAIVGGFDLRNATFGSQPTHYKPGLDGTIQLVLVGGNFELNVGYERFNYTFTENKLEVKAFEKYSLGVGWHFPLYGYIGGNEIKTTLIPTIEPSIIWRPLIDHNPMMFNGVNTNEGGMKVRPGFATIGLNVAWQWNISDRFALQLATNFLPRPDLEYLYGQNKIVISNYGKIVYKFSK